MNFENGKNFVHFLQLWNKWDDCNIFVIWSSRVSPTRRTNTSYSWGKNRGRWITKIIFSQKQKIFFENKLFSLTRIGPPPGLDIYRRWHKDYQNRRRWPGRIVMFSSEFLWVFLVTYLGTSFPMKSWCTVALEVSVRKGPENISVIK